MLYEVPGSNYTTSIVFLCVVQSARINLHDKHCCDLACCTKCQDQITPQALCSCVLYKVPGSTCMTNIVVILHVVRSARIKLHHKHCVLVCCTKCQGQPTWQTMLRSCMLYEVPGSTYMTMLRFLYVVQSVKINLRVCMTMLWSGWTAWFRERIHTHTHKHLSLIHIWRCRRVTVCRSRWSPYH